MSEENLNIDGIRPDGIETLEGGLENYQQEQEENESLEYDLTFDEKKKLLRALRKKNNDTNFVYDEDVENLSKEQIEELKEFAKLKERGAIYKFVNRVKIVDDKIIENLTDEEVEDMIAKSYVMAQHFSYNTKKKFGVSYKKKRQNRNKMAKASRKANR